MLLTEYNEAETMELFRRDGRKEGIKEGIKEGANQFASLIKKLRELGRHEDAEKAIEDPDFRRVLYAEFHIDYD